MSGLHRRNSSALYQQLTPQPGGPGDITNELESYSSATPRPRTGSLAAEQRALEALEEKEGFIPDSQYDLPGSGRRSAGRRKGGGLFGWKSKLLLTMLLGGGIGAAAYFYFYSDTGLWWEGREQEEVVSWTEEAATKASQAAGSAATGVKHFAFGSEDDSTTTASATYYLNEGEYDDAPYEEEGEEEEDDSSSNRKTTLASNATSGSFSSSASADVTRLLENGTLAAYRWHETLPSLNGSSSASTYKKQDGGRLIVVGDVHGTHTSLLRLLKRLSFSPSQDTLIHTGDILAKSSLNDSLTTVSLLRRFGAKGVRGNHDQKVIEWRKWMEAYGPLDRNSTSAASSSSSSSKALKGVQEAVAAIGSKAQAGFAAKQDVKSGFRKVASNAGAAKLNALSHPREKAKRGWLDWLTGGAGSDDGSEELLQEQDNLAAEYAAEEQYGAALGASGSNDWRDEDAQAAGPDWDELNALESRLSSASDASATSASRVATSTLSSSSSSSSTTTSPHRRPFGRPTSLTSSSSASSTRSSSSSRPSSTASSRLDSLSSLSSDDTSSTDGSLTGPLYSWLSPSLSSSELKKLGVVVPEGWDWGGEHFEIARHLSQKDVEYLEELPLTLWVEEIKSWVVHAGMVPWTSLSTTLSRLPSTTLSSSASSALPSLLTSTSPLQFSPTTSLSRLLSHSSSRTAILLEPLNTDPYTLLNMRTLHSSPSSKGSGKIKGPSTTWTASSKGRKAGKGSRPWWAVWEEGMIECAEQGEEGCEEAGVIYGHWAGQGLQVQPHSIGLDTGCAYGRRLSALVVPLSSSSSSSSKSPLGSTLSSSSSSASHRLLNSTSHSKINASYASLSPTKGVKGAKGKSASASSSSSSPSVASQSEPTSTSTSTSTRARPNWHGGMEKVTKSVASALASSSASAKPSASPFLSEVDEEAGSSYREDSPVVEEEEGEKPWWRPWKRDDSEKDELELEKRGPPQGRPGVAPWSSSGQREGAEIEEEEGYEYAGGYEEEEVSTATSGRGRPTKTSSVLSATDSSTPATKGKGKARPSSVSSTVSSPSATSTGTGSGRKLSSSAAFTSSDDDEEEEALEVADLAAAAEEEQQEEEDESAFEEQEVHLAATGEKGKGQVRAWVVSVDCGGDFDTE